MPLVANGIYAHGPDRPYEAESAYYLNYQIISALASLDYLNKAPDEGIWENRCQYFHFYTDHLMFSVGQIANRFVITNRDDQLTEERKKQNRQNFQFTDDEYPILSNKLPRNTIEHIDEHDQAIIQTYRGVGGFNLIDDQTKPDLIVFFRNNTHTHPYTLDLLQRKLFIRRGENDLVIDLDALKNELLSLQGKVKYFQQIVSNIF